MSHKKRKRWAIWVEKGKTTLPQEIYQLLPPLILDLALVEDVTGPSFTQIIRDEYLAHLSSRLRGPVTRELNIAGIIVPDEQLAEICRIAAGETFVIRGLNEARIKGEISLEGFRHLPFFRTYQNYFEHTQGVVAKARNIASSAAAKANRHDSDIN